jgi:hypothetical protein
VCVWTTASLTYAQQEIPLYIHSKNAARVVTDVACITVPTL